MIFRRIFVCRSMCGGVMSILRFMRISLGFSKILPEATRVFQGSSSCRNRSQPDNKQKHG